MELEQILNTYISGDQTGEDNKLRATVGKLSAERSKELTNAISTLQKQIPVSISDLRSTISNNADKIIQSNEKLSRSNENYAKWMKWLTFGLFAVGITQAIISLWK